MSKKSKAESARRDARHLALYAVQRAADAAIAIITALDDRVVILDADAKPESIERKIDNGLAMMATDASNALNDSINDLDRIMRNDALRSLRKEMGQ